MKEILVLALVLISMGSVSVYGATEKYKVWLDEGMNTITVPIQPIDNTIPNVLKSIKGDYNAVWWYDEGYWYSYNPQKPDFLNTLWEINKDETYYFSMSKKVNLKMRG